MLIRPIFFFSTLFLLLIGQARSEQASWGNGQLVFNGLLEFGDKSAASLFDSASKSSFWVELGKSRNGITLEEIDENGEWVRISYSGASRVIDYAKPKIVDPLTFKRMNTASGISNLSVQDVIEEKKRADRVEMDLMVYHELAKERRKKANKARR